MEGENQTLYSLFQDTSDIDDLFLLLMGILQNEEHFSFSIKWKHTIHKTTKITAQYIQKIHSEWTSFQDSSDSDSVGYPYTPLSGSAGGL